jgi:hypothetical protein
MPTEVIGDLRVDSGLGAATGRLRERPPETGRLVVRAGGEDNYRKKDMHSRLMV